MATIQSTSQVLGQPEVPFTLGEDQLAAVAFLARYSGRTLEAYRHDLRALFGWAADHGLAVLEATRTHLELYRTSMEERGLAASTIDRRLSTACGFYRFAHIDGRIASNPAQYVRRPKVHPSERRGLDRGELGGSSSPPSASTTPSRPGGVVGPERTAGFRGVRYQHRGHGHGAGTSSAPHRRQRPQAGAHPPRARTARTIDLAIGERREGPILLRQDGHRLDRRTAYRWVSSSATGPGSDWSTPTCSGCVHHGRPGRRGTPQEVQIAARHSDPRTTTVYDRRRQDFDRHAAYVVVAFVAGG